MNIFELNSYRDVVKHYISKRKVEVGKHINLTNLAKACRVQKTYLSAVLHGRGHLSQDQLYDSAQFLNIPDSEYVYVQLLLEMERSISTARQVSLKKQIDALRQENLQTQKQVSMRGEVALDAEALTEFYTNINAQFVHMFLTVDQYRNDPKLIAQKLQLSAQVMQKCLAILERANLIEFDFKKIVLLREDLYLPVTSPLNQIFRTQLRLKSLERLNNQANAEDYSFSVLFSANKDARDKVKSRFFEFLNWTKDYCQASRATDVYQMNFDLIKWD